MLGTKVDNLQSRYGITGNNSFSNYNLQVFAVNSTVFLCLEYIEERFRILRSDDNGTSWRDFGTGINSAFGSVRLGGSTSFFQSAIISNSTALFGLRFSNFLGTNSNTLPRVIRASVNTPTSVIQNTATEDNIIENCFIAPNPSLGKTSLHYTLTKPGYVTIQLYGILGDTIATVTSEYQQSGYYSVPIDVSHLPIGQYYYRLRIGVEQTARSLQVVR